ncbi:MAG: phytanoyl-CoA dioxygenase family protein [Gemmataceae bacterium]
MQMTSMVGPRSGGVRPSSPLAFLRRFPGVRSVVDRLRRNAPVLTEIEVTQFHSAGYLIVDPGVPLSQIDRAAADMMQMPGIQGATHHGTRVFNGWKQSQAIRSIAFAPRVHRILRQLYGRKALPFQTLNFPIGTEQKVHSDVIHFDSDPPSFMCGVWVALEDIDEQNGALVYYPGSHKLPVIRMEDFAPGPGTEHYPAYEATIAKLVRDKQLKSERAILRKGQALIWSSNLLHGGGSHVDKSRTRMSQVTHYYFEGCQYFMPLESYGGYRHLKLDDWVQ